MLHNSASCILNRYARALLLCSLVLASLYLNLSLVELVKTAKSTKLSQGRSVRSNQEYLYSYVGDDFPAMLPVDRTPVQLIVEDSVRYSLSDPEAAQEWLYTGPIGDHHARLGKDKRTFVAPVFHQLHCLRSMREALETGGYDGYDAFFKGHMHHCFVYLRQWALCSADVTLERGDFTKRNFTTQRIGATHTCQDWQPVYRKVEDSWESWETYREAHGLPSPYE